MIIIRRTFSSDGHFEAFLRYDAWADGSWGHLAETEPRNNVYFDLVHGPTITTTTH